MPIEHMHRWVSLHVMYSNWSMYKQVLLHAVRDEVVLCHIRLSSATVMSGFHAPGWHAP